MLITLITSIIGTGYALNVILSLFIVVVAFNKQVILELFPVKTPAMPKPLIIVEVLAATFSELPLHLLLVKYIGMQLTWLFGGLRK